MWIEQNNINIDSNFEATKKSLELWDIDWALDLFLWDVKNSITSAEEGFKEGLHIAELMIWNQEECCSIISEWFPHLEDLVLETV